MNAHNCKELTDGCYRCELNRDEIEANLVEDAVDAETAWVEYRDALIQGHIVGGNSVSAHSLHRITRRLRKREFIAGFMAGRQG